MIKYWYHPFLERKEDGCFCKYCGIPMEGELQYLHPQKCRAATSAVSLWEDYMFEVSVWDMRASLLVFRHDNSGQRIYLKLDISPEIESMYKKLLNSCPYEAGGAINISGTYPLSEKFENFLEEHLNSGKIKIIDVSQKGHQQKEKQIASATPSPKTGEPVKALVDKEV